MNSKRTQSGLTLLELMVAVAVAGIVLTIAVPSFRALIQNNRAVSQANHFVSAINLARSEAVKRSRNAQVCVDTNPATNACEGADWQAGWRVWVDDDRDGVVDAGETLLVGEPLGGGSTLTSLDAVTALQYRPSGSLVTALANGTFQLRLPNCSGTANRDITLAPTGRPTISAVACP